MYNAGGCRSCQSASGPAVAMNPYQGSRSVVPVMTQQVSMPQRATGMTYYPNNLPSNQMTSYTTTNQMMSTDAAYSSYLSRPPQDVQYTLAHGSSGFSSDYLTDGWNGMWRQSSRAYREMPAHQQPAAQQMMYATPAHPSHQMMTMPAGPYNVW